MVEITDELEKLIEEKLRKSRFNFDDCISDDEFEDWAGCKRASRDEIRKNSAKRLSTKAEKEKKFVFGNEIPSEIEIESKWKVKNVDTFVDCHFRICINGATPSLKYVCFIPSCRKNGMLKFYAANETKDLSCEDAIPFYLKAEKIIENGENEGTMKITMNYDSGARWEIEKPMTKENLEPIIRILKSAELRKLPKLLSEMCVRLGKVIIACFDLEIWRT